MHYLDLSTNSSSQLPRNTRSKKIALALLAVGVLACLGAVLLLNSNGSQKQFIVNLAYNQEAKNQVISSTRVMNVCTNQYDLEQDGVNDSCTQYTTTQDIVITRTSEDILSVYVVYNSINEKKMDSSDPLGDLSIDDMINDDEKGYEAYYEELDLAFKATISTQGILLSLESPNGDQADTLVRLTERLIQQTFPEIDPELYNSPYQLRKSSSSRRRLLDQSADDSLVTQDTSLGEVSADYTYLVDSEGQTILTKEYTDDDFVTFDYHLGGELPDIMYVSNTVVDQNGFVASNTESMHFNFTDPLANDHEDVIDELLGFLSVRIDSTMKVHSVSDHNEELFETIRKYEEAAAFKPVDLESDGGFISYSKNASQENVIADEFLLGESAQLSYTKTVSVFQKSVLSQNIELKIIQQNYEIFSDVFVSVYLNNFKVYDLYTQRIEHPWLACNSTINGSGQNFDKQYEIFEVQYPIMGIITIPLRASIRVNLGWSLKLEPQNEICNVLFNIYAKPAIAADGGLSVLNVAEGGVSFGGSVANGYFNFNVYVNRLAFSAVLDINAQMIPFEYTIDAYYRIFRCDFKELFSRNLFLKKLVKKVASVVKTVVSVATKIVQICGLSDPSYVNLLKGQLGNTYAYSISKEGFLLKNKN